MARARLNESFISLFSGAGGLDLGFERAGWSPLAQIDSDPNCAATLRATAGEGTRRIYGEPIEDIDPRELMAALGLREGELGALVGGPPCQPFTTAGLRRATSDERASTAFPTYLDYVRVLRPRAVVMENVTGLLSAALRHRPLKDRRPDAAPLAWDEQKGSFLYCLLHEFAVLGYSVSWGILEAADYGVPQMRQRALLIGVREEEVCFLPTPSFGPMGAAPWRTLRDAIGALDDIGPVQPLSERKRSVFAQVPPGGNWRDLPDPVREATMGRAYFATGGKSGWWRRLSWEDPAPTILGMPDHSSTALVHPDEVRCLSVKECALLQSFPEGYRFCGPPRSQYQQIGNAVPPLLAEAVGRQVLRFLDGERKGTPPVPQWRQTSANRKIGTHGWMIHHPTGPEFTFHASVRADHVWASHEQQSLLS